MIFTPWGLGLTLASIAVLVLLVRATVPALILLFRREQDDSAFQLKLEKEEVLSGAILRFSLIYLVFSPFLLLKAAFELGKQIPGAMCAFGTFNANAFGFPLVFVRLVNLFPAVAWLVLYSLDMRSPATPFRRIRRIVLLIIFILFLADTTLQSVFLFNLDPLVITSCCAVVLDPTGDFLENPAGILAIYPKPVAYFTVSIIILLIGVIALAPGKRILKMLYGGTALFFFFFCFAAMTSFISPYIYALPHHHCPFCILAGKEALFGIPLTLSVFIGGVYGWAGGIVEWAGGVAGLPGKNITRQRNYQLASIVAFAVYVAGSAGIIILYRIYGGLL